MLAVAGRRLDCIQPQRPALRTYRDIRISVSIRHTERWLMLQYRIKEEL
jgi:hypothetical protein